MRRTFALIPTALSLALVLPRAAAADTAAGEPAAPTATARAEPEPAAPTVTLGGALRFNYFLKTWPGQEANRDRLGDLAFDTFRVNVDGAYGPLELSAEYRFYPGYHMLHHGWVGWNLDAAGRIDVGVSQAPFGLLPYASHNWFFDLGYYIGLEDDYDFGVRWAAQHGPWDVRLAFFKNDEGHYSGGSVDSARYSYDVVRTTVDELGYAGLQVDRSARETNEGVARVVYALDHGETGSTEVGVSGRYGGLYDEATGETGSRWAGAAHVHGAYGPFDLQLEAARYAFSPVLPAGADARFVPMGAYDAPYLVSSSGWLLVANLAYGVDVDWGPVSKLTFYDDYSRLVKTEDGFADSEQNVLGVLIEAGPVYTYVDAAAGRNHPWLGPDWGTALAAGDPDAPWHLRFNVNVGWYF